MAISAFEIHEITMDGKKVYQIVDDGEPVDKRVLVNVDEWELFVEHQEKEHAVKADPAIDVACHFCKVIYKKYDGCPACGSKLATPINKADVSISNERKC